MKTTVKWTDGAMFVGESGSGHTVVMDGPEDLGGRNMGPRPMEMLLMGTGGCSIYDVMSMLKKSRQQVVDCRVEMQAERADAVPAVFTSHQYAFRGDGCGAEGKPRKARGRICRQRSTAPPPSCFGVLRASRLRTALN